MGILVRVDHLYPNQTPVDRPLRNHRFRSPTPAIPIDEPLRILKAAEGLGPLNPERRGQPQCEGTLFCISERQLISDGRELDGHINAAPRRSRRESHGSRLDGQKSTIRQPVRRKTDRIAVDHGFPHLNATGFVMPEIMTINVTMREPETAMVRMIDRLTDSPLEGKSSDHEPASRCVQRKHRRRPLARAQSNRRDQLTIRTHVNHLRGSTTGNDLNRRGWPRSLVPLINTHGIGHRNLIGEPADPMARRRRVRLQKHHAGVPIPHQEPQQISRRITRVPQLSHVYGATKMRSE